jgi:transposase-like protein
MARRGYPPEFRRRVLDLVDRGRTVSEVANDLEVSEQTIYTWRRQARSRCAAVGERRTR